MKKKTFKRWKHVNLIARLTPYPPPAKKETLLKKHFEKTCLFLSWRERRSLIFYYVFFQFCYKINLKLKKATTLEHAIYFCFFETERKMNSNQNSCSSKSLVQASSRILSCFTTEVHCSRTRFAGTTFWKRNSQFFVFAEVSKISGNKKTPPPDPPKLSLNFVLCVFPQPCYY